VGCTSPLILSQRADMPPELDEPEIELADGAKLLRDVARPWGTNFIKVESVGLLTGLDGTGSDPPPSARRTTLTSEMQTHEVKNPNHVLASPNTSLVLIRAYLPPGVRKGDRFDVEVLAPTRSETTSLRQGWLMRTRLREVALVNNTFHTGRVDALAEGQVVVDAVFDKSDNHVKEVRGRVLGGGVAVTSRPMGLVVKSENHSVKTASLIGAAINRRFHTYDRGVKRGVATPKRDSFVELQTHPRYKHNLGRYVQVIRHIALGETPTERMNRIELLERKLHEPTTSANAALQLEAIGKEALSVLQKGVQSLDPEVRFYAAEALAYLDGTEGTDALVEAARGEPAFRWHAIAALAAMEHASAYDGLTELLHVPSAETRYAAFRALRSRNPLDPLVRGEKPGDAFSIHAVSTTGPPMVHFARARHPEVVVFGHDQTMRPPKFLFAGKKIMLKAEGTDQIRVLRFETNEEDRSEVCSTRVVDVVRTIAKLGGNYEDVIEAIQSAKAKECLTARVATHALPRPGREYRRRDDGSDEESAIRPTHGASPLPEMFADRLGAESGESDYSGGGVDQPRVSRDRDDEDTRQDTGFLGTLGGWLTES
jgi:flagellar basal body P-ring protein FlgI